jgi:tyrosinase
VTTTRKSAFALTAAEQQRYINAVKTLNSGGGTTQFAAFVAIHADMSHNMHTATGPVGHQRFLPWHRDFLLQFEKALQAVDPAAFIPYWKWSTNRQLPPWIASFLPTVKVPAVGGMAGMPGMGGTPAQTVHVTRTPHSPSALPTANQIQTLDANTSITYTQFTGLLEGYHNTVHNWVGGTMTDITISPADPLFWTHHAEIDRIWSVWQAQPHNKGKKPKLTGDDAVMDPWKEKASQLTSIDKLGYAYA